MVSFARRTGTMRIACVAHWAGTAPSRTRPAIKMGRKEIVGTSSPYCAVSTMSMVLLMLVGALLPLACGTARYTVSGSPVL